MLIAGVFDGSASDEPATASFVLGPEAEREMTMVRYTISISTTVLRLVAALALLGCPRMGFAAGTWSVIAPPPKPGEVVSPGALAVDTAGNLYVADMAYWGHGRIQKRDAQGSWSILATAGDAPGQVDFPTALAVDTGGNLYVVDNASTDYGNGRIQKRDAQGNCYENRIPGPVQARRTPAAPRLAAATGR
jgi:hypothetical protein